MSWFFCCWSSCTAWNNLTLHVRISETLKMFKSRAVSYINWTIVDVAHLTLLGSPCSDFLHRYGAHKLSYYYYFLTFGSNSRGRKKIDTKKLSDSKRHHPVGSRRRSSDGAEWVLCRWIKTEMRWKIKVLSQSSPETAEIFRPRSSNGPKDSITRDWKIYIGKHYYYHYLIL